MGATEEYLSKFPPWWYANDWRGNKGDPPKPFQVQEVWTKFKSHTEGKIPKSGNHATNHNHAPAAVSHNTRMLRQFIKSRTG
jgi:hypothetical protein